MGPCTHASGRNGRDYFAHHYAWPVIERKYLDMFRQLGRSQPSAAPDPLPGWLARRRKDLPPASEVLARVPSGAVNPDAASRRDRPA